jgi:hypothetical protein
MCRCLVVLALAGACARTEAPPAPPAEAVTVSACQKLEVVRGGIGGGQSARALASRDLAGSQDTWEKHVVFDPGSEVTCTFPANDGVEGLSLRFNYRGPDRRGVRWIFEAWDATAGAWVYLGDNSHAVSDRWSARELPLPGPIARFVAANQVSVRYRATGAGQASSLDEWVLTADRQPPLPEAPPPPVAARWWRPQPGTTWQWKLTGKLEAGENVQAYAIDLFDAPQAFIDRLHREGQAAICHFSAGVREDWRPDASAFPAAALGQPLLESADERWLDVRHAAVRAIIGRRLDLAVRKQCDGVAPDNVDGHANQTGFALTPAGQLEYNRWLAREAHARNLSVGLCNDVEQVAQLVDHFDWAINEECLGQGECDRLRPFVVANKAVFHVEYPKDEANAASICARVRPLGFSTLLKRSNLGGWGVPCTGLVAAGDEDGPAVKTRRERGQRSASAALSPW